MLLGSGDSSHGRVGRLGDRHRDTRPHGAGSARAGRLHRARKQRAACLRHRDNRQERRRGAPAHHRVAALRERRSGEGRAHHQVSDIAQADCQGSERRGGVAHRLSGRYSRDDQRRRGLMRGAYASGRYSGRLQRHLRVPDRRRRIGKSVEAPARTILETRELHSRTYIRRGAAHLLQAAE